MRILGAFAVLVLLAIAFVGGTWVSSRWGVDPLQWRFGAEQQSSRSGMSMPGMTGDEMPAGADAGDRKVLYWKSPMNPGEIHQEPGQDSMGMELVPVYEGDAAGPGEIRIDPATRQNMGVRIGEVVRGPVRKTVRTVGIVDYDETSLSVVTTKVDGWVEKLFVEETGAQVHAGDPLCELYSPELFSAQEEFLAALRNQQKSEVATIPRSRRDSAALVEGARTRLRYFDISEEQIDELERTGKVRKTLTLRAPSTGIVTHKNLVEGTKVVAGKDLMRIADLSRVWVIGKVFEFDLPYIHVGGEARMRLSYIPGKTFRGRITYEYPFLEGETREVAVRMEFHNPGYELKPGMYATLEIEAELAKDAVLAPESAIIDTGTRAVAFVEGKPGQFSLRNVRTGPKSGEDHVQVLSGLSPGEKIVVSGQFLLDSESRLREAALKFLDADEPGSTPSDSPAEADSGERAKATGLLGSGHEVHYVCPMPEHSSILYAAAGTCPLCGESMQLVPADPSSERDPIRYWTCPMPEHSAIHESGPGKCPECGMTLIPVRLPAPQGDSTPDR